MSCGHAVAPIKKKKKKKQNVRSMNWIKTCLSHQKAPERTTSN